jgi:hypothetical protein
MEKSVMLKFSRLHSDSFLVYDSDNNHIGEVSRLEEYDYNTWRVILGGNDIGVEYINLRDAQKAAEHVYTRNYEIDPFDVGC